MITNIGLPLDTAALTDIGPRDRQQDNMLTGSNFVVVADGVSSRETSDTAAAIAVDTYASAMRNAPSSCLLDALLKAPRLVQERLWNAGATGLTTVAAAVADGSGRLWLTHLGDTQILVARNGHTRYLSRPHTLLADAEIEGRLDEYPDDEDGAGNRRAVAANTVSRYLGAANPTSGEAHTSRGAPFVTATDLHPADRVVVTTDGIHNRLTATELLRLTRSATTASELAHVILDQARHAGLTDNATVAVLQAVVPVVATDAGGGEL